MAVVEAKAIISRTGGGFCLELQVALHQLAQLFAIFILHMNKFDSASVLTDVSNYSGEVNFAQAGANFELDGISDGEFLGRFEVCAAQTYRFYSSEHGLGSVNLRSQRRFQRNPHIPSRH